LLATDPAALANNVRALHGSSSFRLRVGTWRVVFKTDAEHIRVVDVGPRGSIYD
jgi:mRNA interferase RelE/StbE